MSLVVLERETMRRILPILFLPLLAACFGPEEEEEVVMVEPEPLVIEDLDATFGQ